MARENVSPNERATPPSHGPCCGHTRKTMQFQRDVRTFRSGLAGWFAGMEGETPLHPTELEGTFRDHGHSSVESKGVPNCGFCNKTCPPWTLLICLETETEQLETIQRGLWLNL